MAGLVDPDDLVGTADIAARLGAAQHKVVNEWIRRYPDFPKPLRIIGGVKIWNWSDVERWALATGRLGLAE